MLSKVHISPPKVTMYAVFPIISNEVGRLSLPVILVNEPSPLTLTTEPRFRCAYEVAELSPQYALLLTIRRWRDIVELPDLAGQANHIGIVADELHRGGQV
jgi:hypothetical protein